MHWKSLGTLSPGIGWVRYPEAVTDCETLRVVQTWGVDRPVSYALLGQYFPGGGFGSFHKIWAIDNEPRVIILPIPAALRVAGDLTYQLQLKLGRFPHMGIDDWHIELQSFVSGV